MNFGKKRGNIRLIWFGHSCFKIEINETSLFFDPVKKNNLLLTDLNPEKEDNISAIFISHDHWDHYNPETIIALFSQVTKIFCPLSVINQIYHQLTFKVDSIKEFEELRERVLPTKKGDVIEINSLSIKCLDASEGLSFLIDSVGKKLLFMGDSVATKEMIKEKPDVLFFPIWAVRGEEAELDDFLELAKNRLCIPMHYHQSQNALPNFYVDIREIKELLNNINMEILDKNKIYYL